MNKNDNQRTRLTKLLFKNSLIKLLHKKTIYQITVSELCTEAELNRSTFYKYYGNVYDILEELAEETLAKGTQCIQEIEAAGLDYGKEPLYHLLCYVRENKDIYQLLLNNTVNGDFPEKMLKSIIDFFKREASLAINNMKMSEYTFQYLVSGSISVIQNWINGPMTESPSEISNHIYDLSVCILTHMNMLPEEYSK
ncbi:MAG: TetR/AcrR family transcriptional regulator [Eubacterium sp.]|jgi:AcrR family transcriptional regulator|nr:TetR/AcrR family transcriptional regulator [Eubacterium sp.]